MKEINTYPLLQDLFSLHAGWAKDDDKWNFGPVCSVFMRFYWVTYGSATIIMNGEEHTLTEGHYYLVPPYVTHFERSTGPFEYYYLHVFTNPNSWRSVTDRYTLPFEVPAEKSLCRMMQEYIERRPELRLPHPSPASYESVSELTAAARRFSNYDLAVQCEMVSLSLLMLSRFLRKATRRPSVQDARIKEIISLIEDEPGKTFSVRQMAEHVALSSERFIRLFNEQIGMTPKRYILLRKIGQAQSLLASRENTIKEVARHLGYESVSHFTQMFRQLVGMTPREFQLQNT